MHKHRDIRTTFWLHRWRRRSQINPCLLHWDGWLGQLSVSPDCSFGLIKGGWGQWGLCLTFAKVMFGGQFGCRIFHFVLFHGILLQYLVTLFYRRVQGKMTKKKLASGMARLVVTKEGTGLFISSHLQTSEQIVEFILKSWHKLTLSQLESESHRVATLERALHRSIRNLTIRTGQLLRHLNFCRLGWSNLLLIKCPMSLKCSKFTPHHECSVILFSQLCQLNHSCMHLWYELDARVTLILSLILTECISDFVRGW